MFTGLIEDIGTLTARRGSGQDVTLEIATAIPLADVAIGDSIAVNGVCLTVTSIAGERFSADASRETLDRSSLGRLREGGRVHLERALAANGRLGGHIVQGHVDGTGVLARRTAAGRAWDLWIDVPDALRVELVPKGSVTVDGVSLTVNDVTPTGFRLTIIPHTENKTLLVELPLRSVVNIETDVIGKYVRRYLGLDQRDGMASLLQRFGFTPDKEN
jgi:riboflavin synthase